ncbi:hypothetical protein ACFL96_07650 [Thermoproteota archaeon]
MRKLIMILMILVLVSGITLAFDLTVRSPFKGIEVEFEKEKPVSKETLKPNYCETDDDCEPAGCGCFNKNRENNKEFRCLINISVDKCTCMNNICIPDLSSIMNKFKGINIRKYQRKVFFKPECPKIEHMFINNIQYPETALLVLAFKGNSEFNNFLDENCGSPLLKPNLDKALGGEFFEPCQGFDFLYSECSSFEADSCDWFDPAISAVENKRTACKDDFKNCSFHSAVKERIETNHMRCLNRTRNYTERCGIDCNNLLSAKERCELQTIEKNEFIQDAYGKIKKICSMRDTLLDKARTNTLDADLEIDILEAEMMTADANQGYRRYGNLNIFDVMIFKIKKAFNIAKETDDKEVLRKNTIKDIDAAIEELELLATETEDDAVKDAIESQVTELTKKKVIID